METRNLEVVTEEQTCTISAVVDKTLQDSFADNLYFLWRLSTNPSTITTTNCIPIVQPPKINWFHQISRFLKPPTPVAATTGTTLTGPTHANLTTAMNKVSEAWERQIDQQETKDREKKDKANWSAWENLAEVQRKTILLASMGNDLVPPEKLTPNMIEILRCTNGSRVELELHQKLSRNIICLDPGLCSCLCKGLLISQPSENDINYFSPAFTSSVPNEKKNKAMTALHYMVQASVGKVSDSMIADMTK